MLKNEMPQKEEATDQKEIPEENDFWNPQRVRLLGASIIIMSFLLILGFGMVVYKLIEKALVSQPTSISQTTSDIEKVQKPTMSPAFEIDLNGYQIKHMTSTGQKITLYVQKRKKAQIWIIDIASKKVEKIININK